jgi:hypothetical protein
MSLTFNEYSQCAARTEIPSQHCPALRSWSNGHEDALPVREAPAVRSATRAAR